jgi:uncharacterized integral membrane protein
MTFQDGDPTKPKPRIEERHGASSGSNGPSVKLILLIVLVVVVAVFIIANDHTTKISFGVYTWETTVRWAIFIAVLLGVALDRLVLYAFRRRSDRKAARQQGDE